MKKALLLCFVAIFSFNAMAQNTNAKKINLDKQTATNALTEDANSSTIDNKFEQLKLKSAKAIENGTPLTMEEQKAMETELKGKFAEVMNAANKAKMEEQNEMNPEMKGKLLELKNDAAKALDNNPRKMKEIGAPEKIRVYVSENYPGQHIRKWETRWIDGEEKYVTQLTNGTELIFNNQQEFVEVNTPTLKSSLTTPK